MANIATKPQSSDDNLVPRLAISKNMLIEPDVARLDAGRC